MNDNELNYNVKIETLSAFELVFMLHVYVSKIAYKGYKNCITAKHSERKRNVVLLPF